MKSDFKVEGVVTALVTPLTDDEEVNEVEFRKLVDFQIEHGVTGFFVTGTLGEGMKLPLETRKRAVEIVVEHTKGRVPVIVHIGTPSTKTSIELAKHAADIGADAISAIGPFFYKPDVKGLIKHYKAIGEAVDIPLLVYNNAGRQGYNISPDIFEKIAKEVPQIVGLKDTSYNVEQLHEYVHRFGEKYIIAAAGDSMIFVAFVIGASAHISGVSNLFPEIVVELYKSVQRGELEKAKQLQSKINEIRRALKKVSEIAAYKAALKFRGINAGTVSSPLRQLTDEEIQELEKDLRQLSLI